MNQDELKTNLLDADAWLRILSMIVLAFLAWLTLIGLGMLVVVQAVIALVAGNPNRNLQKLGYLLSRYLSQAIDFLLYNSEHKPFPFADFPGTDDFNPPPAREKPRTPARPTQSPMAQAAPPPPAPPPVQEADTVRADADFNTEAGNDPDSPDPRSS